MDRDTFSERFLKKYGFFAEKDDAETMLDFATGWKTGWKVGRGAENGARREVFGNAQGRFLHKPLPP